MPERIKFFLWLVCHDREVKITHIYREANCCVDALASIGCHHAHHAIFYHHPPLQLKALLLAHVTRVSTQRLVVP